jgi:GGDEF domain-containing protein
MYLDEVHAELMQSLNSLADANLTLPAYWTGAINALSAAMSKSLEQDAALEIASGLLGRLIEDYSTDTESRPAIIPQSVYRDPESALFTRAFFASDYARYDRGNNSMVLLRYDPAKDLSTSRAAPAIQLLGGMVLRSIRTVDVPCRWSEHEIVVLLPRTTVDQASIVAQRIHDAAASIGFLDNAVTIGIAAALNGEHFDQLYGRADWAVYNAQVSNASDIAVG